MKRCIPLILAALVLSAPLPALAWPGVVTQIVDGDTITVAPQGQTDAPIRVRLYGIDAPEQLQEYGQEATAALAELLPVGELADIIPMASDKYGRTVGLVIRDGMTINHELLSSGHAWVTPKYCRAYFCKRWMSEAKKAKKAGSGLWGNGKPEAPWDWRKKNPSERP